MPPHATTHRLLFFLSCSTMPTTTSLCLLFVGLIVATSNAELPVDATTWTSAQVNEWVDTLNTPSALKIKAGVSKHGITGNILMVIDDTDLNEELGVASSIERKTIFAAITALKDSSREMNAQLTFWELRSLNRQMVDYTTPLLTTAPRWAITTFDDFPKYCQPAALLGEGNNIVLSWLEWAIFPEWYIWKNRDTIMCGLPGFVPYVCFANLLIGVGCIISGFMSNGFQGATSAALLYVLYKLGGELAAGCGAWMYSATVWRILPWFICDMLFYFSVYIMPVTSLFANSKQTKQKKQ